MSKNTLLVSVTAIKERTAVHNNMDEKLIAGEIKHAQDIEIVAALGTLLFERIQTGVTDGDLTADEQTLLDDYITDTLIHFVLAALPMSSSFQFFTKGMLRRSGDNVDLPSMSDLVDLSQWYKNRAEYYRERLIRYLRLNRDTFSTYLTCTDNDINPAKAGYSVPCWLPDDDCECDEP